MALGKQAKIISDKQVRAVLTELDTRRYPLRDRLMFLLSMKAGMRAVEIASVTWSMVTDAEGEICDVIALENRASKGKVGGRHIPMHPEIKAALMVLRRERGDKARPDWPVIHSERERVCRRVRSLCGSIGFTGISGWSAVLAIQVAELSSPAPPEKSARLAEASGTSSNSPVTQALEQRLATSRAITTRNGKSLP
jgi:integrase